MAYVFNPNISDEENRRLAAEQEAGRPATGEIAGGVQPAGATPGAPTSSGSFTNIQRYLSENQPQAKALGERVAGQINQAGEEAKTAAEGFVQDANQRIEAGGVPADNTVIDEAAANPVSVASDATKKAEFLRRRDADYTGPQGLEDVEGFSSVQDKVRKAQERLNLAGTEAGRTQILTDMSPAGSGRGKLALNQLLISGNQEASDIVAGAGQPYANLGAYLTAESDAARAKAVKASQDTAAARRAVQDRFLGEGGVVPAFASDLDARVASTRQQTDDQWGAITQKLTNAEPLSDQELQMLGMSREEIDAIYRDAGLLGADYQSAPALQDFLRMTGSSGLITRENLATDDDYARSIALQELLGEQPNMLGAATRPQAGTAVTDLGDYDRTAIAQVPAQLKAKDEDMWGGQMMNPASGKWAYMNGTFGWPSAQGYIKRALTGLNAGGQPAPMSWQDLANAFQPLNSLPAQAQNHLSVEELQKGIRAAARLGKFSPPNPNMPGGGFTPEQIEQLKNLGR